MHVPLMQTSSSRMEPSLVNKFHGSAALNHTIPLGPGWRSGASRQIILCYLIWYSGRFGPHRPSNRKHGPPGLSNSYQIVLRWSQKTNSMALLSWLVVLFGRLWLGFLKYTDFPSPVMVRCKNNIFLKRLSSTLQAIIRFSCCLSISWFSDQ